MSTYPPPAAIPRRTAGLLWAAAAALTVAATFVPFYRYTYGQADQKIYEYALSGWSWNLHVENTGARVDFGPPTLYGIPLTICAVVLTLAAVGAFAGLSVKSIGLLATGLLVGAVSIVFVEALANSAAERGQITTETALGTWLLLGAAGLAVVGAVVGAVVVPRRRPEAWPPRVEPDTPRFGIPAAYYGR